MSRKLFPPISFTKNKALAACALLLLATFLSACAAGGQVKKEVTYNLGVLLGTLTPELAQDIGLSQDLKGVIVLGIYQGSPAAAAGLRSGDLIQGISVKGTVAQTPDNAIFSELLRTIPADLPAELSVFREGKNITVSSMRTTENLSVFIQPEARPEPRTIKLAAEGTGDCRTPAGILLMARPGDTILFAPLPTDASYGRWQLIFSNLTLRSEDLARRAVFEQLFLEGLSGVRLEGLDFKATSPEIYPAVYIKNCEGVIVENCSFSGYTRAVNISESREVTVTGNRMEGNSMGIGAYGSDFTFSRNLLIGSPMEGQTVKGIWITASSGDIVNNTILYHKLDTIPFIKSLSSWGPPEDSSIDGAGIHVGTGSNANVENNIVYDNSAGVYIQGNARVRVEYNDIFQNSVRTGGTGPVGIFGSTSFEDFLTGSDWNMSRGVQHRNECAPVLSLSTWNHDYFGPNPVQLSQTNLGQDPFFNDPMRGDYHLAADSPLVGRGRAGTFIGALPPVGQGTGEGAFK